MEFTRTFQEVELRSQNDSVQYGYTEEGDKAYPGNEMLKGIPA